MYHKWGQESEKISFGLQLYLGYRLTLLHLLWPLVIEKDGKWDKLTEKVQVKYEVEIYIKDHNWWLINKCDWCTSLLHLPNHLLLVNLPSILLAWLKKKRNTETFILLLFNEWNTFLSHIFNFRQHEKLLQTVAEKSMHMWICLTYAVVFQEKLRLPFHRRIRQVNKFKDNFQITSARYRRFGFIL